MPTESHIPPSMPTIDEQANHCFGCGPENPHGLHLHFAIDASDPANVTAIAQITLTRMHEGPPGYAHGGIIATLLDEAMSKLNRPLRQLAMTRHMEVDYLRAVPLGVPVSVIGRHLRRDGRKLFHTAEIFDPGGKQLARAKGVFVVIDPTMLERTTSTELEP